MTGPPEFDELVGNDLPAEERTRLERVHGLLIEAGPPPELPQSLAEGPQRKPAEPTWLPRRRIGAVLGLAAAIALVAFLGGYVAGFHRGDNFESTRVVAMQPTSASPGAAGTLKLGKTDTVGNLPMRVTVRGLPVLPQDDYYQLFLSTHGKLILCGNFNVDRGTTTVDFTVPYALSADDRWVVTRWRPGQKEPGRPLLATL